MHWRYPLGKHYCDTDLCFPACSFRLSVLILFICHQLSPVDLIFCNTTFYVISPVLFVLLSIYYPVLLFGCVKELGYYSVVPFLLPE